MSTSKLQSLVKEPIRRLLPSDIEYYENYRPNWLATGYGGRLELDFFIPTLKLAIEVQGHQHASFVEWFHGDDRGFAEQLERDKQKRVTCESLNVILIEIWGLQDIGLLERIFNHHKSSRIPSEWTNLRRLQNPNPNITHPLTLSDLMLYANQLSEALSRDVDKDITRSYVIIKRLGIRNVTEALRSARKSQCQEFANIMQMTALYFMHRKRRPSSSESLAVPAACHRI